MFRSKAMPGLPLLCYLGLILLVSCKSLPEAEKPSPDMPDLHPTYLRYVDSDGFDGLLEIALVNQDPVIVVHTGHAQPDWDGRLNAWIAAWNRGGQHGPRKPSRRASGSAEDEEVPPRITRGQAAIPRVDGESIREFRLLVSGLLDRAEEAANNGAAWWVEERARSRRVSLLKPYSLRFHKDEADQIQLVFFHGSYSSYYPRYMQLLMQKQHLEQEEWTRSIECSCCKVRHRGEAVDQLMNRNPTQ
ncbi:MAG: hypothetical protein U0840_07155 [Gemmataceae bacterium]